MKAELLRVASPRFTCKVLILRWLHDSIFVLKYGLSSPVMRCEPPNYCRLVKQKNRNSVMRACARELFRRFLRPCFLRRRGCRTRWRLSAKSSPISRKSAQGLSRLLLLFSDGTALRERAQGRLGDCAALFLRGARRALLPLPARLRTLGGERFAAERKSRCKSHSRDGSRLFVRFRHFVGAGPSFCVLFF